MDEERKEKIKEMTGKLKMRLNKEQKEDLIKEITERGHAKQEMPWAIRNNVQILETLATKK